MAITVRRESRGMFLTVVVSSLALISCAREAAAEPSPAQAPADPRIAPVEAAALVLPAEPRAAFLAAFRADPERFFALLERAENESAAAGGGLFTLVDKAHALSSGFEPADLAPLDGSSVAVAKPGMTLRRPALKALSAMAAAARAEGVTLVIGSAYRSYAYQEGLFARYAASYGEAEAARFSARAGQSQHQLGAVVDFSPVDDEFAGTKAGAWVAANADRFGFSLSFPQGMEAVTGYKWESWHWRFIGAAGVELQRVYFSGIQQWFLEFLNALNGGA